jgi:WhiB family transcriptional regulator, redox-sensing transcriptional regulator
MPPLSPWQQLAACRTSELDLFFPISAKGRSALDAARAKTICAGCPVRSPCLDYAQATHQVYGIWGGLTEEERHQLGSRPQSPESRCSA